jgi:hypothetical protein
MYLGKLWFLLRVANGVPQTRGNTPSYQKNNGNYFLEGWWTRYNHSIIFHICSRFLEGLGGLSTCYHSQNIYIYDIFFKYIYIHTSGTFTGTPRNLGLKASQFQVSATVSDVPTH